MLQMIRKPRGKKRHIGPEDHGRRMSLDEFDRVIGQEGYTYELNKGVIEVSNVPSLSHGLQVQETRDQLTAHKFAHPGSIHYLAGSNEAKLLVGTAQSERHPDLSLYLVPPPDVKEVWSLWIPTIVIEVVSEGSIKRDYEEKPAEYLELGVDEYWIIDPLKRRMTVLYRWRGQWKKKIVKPGQKYSTHYLAGFALDLQRIFAAAAAAK